MIRKTLFNFLYITIRRLATVTHGEILLVRKYCPIIASYDVKLQG